MNNCPYCGITMAARRKQCGAETCRKAHNAAKMREYYRNHGGNPHRTWYDCTCLGCRHGYKTTIKAGKYCSNTCQAAHEYGADRRSMPRSARRPKTRRERAEAKLAKATAGTRGTQVMVGGWCALCGAAAVARTTTEAGHVFYCSSRCRLTVRAKGLHRSISPATRAYICRRDGYRCQLCRKPVDMTKAMPDPGSPEIDHIIPVSHGGTNKRSNLQLAHRSCNAAKSNRAANEQLMLVG